METSGTSTPPPEPQPRETPPAAPPPPSADKPSGLTRALAIVLAVILLVAVIFMAAFSIEASDSPTCSDTAGVAAEIAEEGPEEATCFESSLLKTATVAFGWLAVGLIAISILTAVMFAATTRFGGLSLRLAVAGVASGVLSILFALID